MKKRPIGIYLLAGVALTLFAVGVFRLFVLRYQGGDIYPPYSSLRTDPLGAKALFEGLDRLETLSCSRNYQSFTKLAELRKTTIFYLGVRHAQFEYAADKDSVIAAEQILANGGRLVVSFFPVTSSAKPWLFEDTENEEREEAKDDDKSGEKTESEKKTPTPADEKPSEKKEADEKDNAALINLAERWGVKFEIAELPKPTTEKDAAPVFAHRADGQTNLPAKLSWHTGLYFTSTSNAWRVIYQRGAYPVMIERAYGNGAIVFIADSYLFSNEAMRNERHADLLAWLAGGHPQVMFDETHLGTMESPGVASLIRKYGLSGFFVSLFLLALLFVWKNSASFVPPQEERFAEGGALGKDMMAGFVNLLRSNIAPNDILPACVAEWEKTFAHLQKDDPALWAQITAAIQAEEARPAKDRHPLKLYRAISRILAGT